MTNRKTYKLIRELRLKQDLAAADARIAKKRARVKHTPEEREASRARSAVKAAAQLRAFHRRYFAATGSWHPDAYEDGAIPCPLPAQ